MTRLRVGDRSFRLFSVTDPPKGSTVASNLTLDGALDVAGQQPGRGLEWVTGDTWNVIATD